MASQSTGSDKPPTTPPTGGAPETPQPPSPAVPIQVAWLDFTKSVRVLMVPQEDNRPLDQYLAFRDTAFNLVQSQQFLNALQSAWPGSNDQPHKELGDAVIMELKAFPLAAEVAQATEKTTPESKWKRRLLGAASTTVGSVKEVKDDLPWYVKGGLTVFKEAIDIFKGGE